MKKTGKKLRWIFIPIGAVLAATILGLLLLIGLAIGEFFLLFPDLQQGGSESLFPDTSITAPTTNPTDPINLRYDAGTLVFCTDGVAYLIGENQQLVETYTGWETETYNSYETPWYGHSSDIISVVIEDGVSPESTDYWFSEFRNLERVRIGNAVTTIGNSAFLDCTSLTSITIPEGVTSIGEGAFAICTSLTSITIPDGVTTIDYAAFSGCTSLTSITIPNSVTTIGEYAFSGCRSLTSITIPDSVTTIGNYAFADCTSLTSITIPEGVTSIGEGAFCWCESLTSIAFGENRQLTTIGEYAFYGCTSLTSITFEGTVAEWNAIVKYSDWNSEVPATEVICSDGIVQL